MAGQSGQGDVVRTQGDVRRHQGDVGSVFRHWPDYSKGDAEGDVRSENEPARRDRRRKSTTRLPPDRKRSQDATDQRCSRR